jgi:methionyl-tRNA formyltransferase
MITKVAFIGSKTLGLNVLRQIYVQNPNSITVVVTLDDSADLRSDLSGFKEFCKSKKIPHEIINKNSHLKPIIEKYLPQLCLVVGWYWILKKEVLDLVPSGWLGIHASLLPAYRGGAPLVWAIINGEKFSGVSLFYFDEGMDSGDIVAQKQFSISATDSIKNVLDKATENSINLISENYLTLLEGKTKRYAQDHTQATYFPMRTPEDGRINWNWENKYIYNFIRAQTHPYPGAYCFLPNQKKMNVWKAEIINRKYQGIPGSVIRVNKEQLTVVCGEGTVIKLAEVSFTGDERFLNLAITSMIQLF